MDTDTKTIESLLSESLFNPLELNNDDIYSPFCDVDPDANYFNKLNAHISQNCIYYYEQSFSTIIQTRFKNMIDMIDHNVLEVKKPILHPSRYVNKILILNFQWLE